MRGFDPHSSMAAEGCGISLPMMTLSSLTIGLEIEGSVLSTDPAAVVEVVSRLSWPNSASDTELIPLGYAPTVDVAPVLVLVTWDAGGIRTHLANSSLYRWGTWSGHGLRVGRGLDTSRALLIMMRSCTSGSG